MTQTWERVLFAHWPVPGERIRKFLPEGLELDLFEGEAWSGVVAFRTSNARLRGIIGLPTAIEFLGLNVRTYVTRGGKPGVWFFSLDAASSLVVFAARLFLGLPYFRSRMRMEEQGGWVHFRSERRDPRGAPAVWRVRYRPAGEARRNELERWLTERYCVYTLKRDQIWRGEIHHAPWPLHRAEAIIGENTMLSQVIRGRPDEPLCHFAERLDVLLWPFRRAEDG